MPNTQITNVGLSYITSAHDSGPLIAIKYCLPVYDYRIDQTQHNEITTSAMAITSAITSADTTPTGEIIYNVNGTTDIYSLSTTDKYVLYTGTESITSGTNWTITGCKHSKTAQINLLNGVPLKDYITGTNVIASSATSTFTVLGASNLSGSNNVPSSTSGTTTGKYFEITDYYPVTDTTTNQVRGSVKFRLSKKIGNVKFNKVALYCVQIDNNGNEVGTPVLFAQTIIDTSTPIIKKNNSSQGFDDIVIDIQIQMNSIAANWSDVMYGTSADYWSITPGGLYYPEKIGIGTFQDSIETPQAKLHVKTSSDTQLRLGYSDTTYNNLTTTSAGSLQVRSVYNATDPNVIPYYSNQSVGSSSNPWYMMWSENLVAGGGTTYNTLTSAALNLRNDSSIYANETANNFGKVKGLDLTREENNVLIYSSYSSTPKDVYICAGVNSSTGYYSDVTSATGQTGMTHNNLVQKVANNTLDNFGNGCVNLLGAGGIRTFGSIYPFKNELDYVGLATSAYNYAFIKNVQVKNIGTYGVGVTSIGLYAHITPGTNKLYDLGTSALNFNNIYANNIKLNNYAIGTWTHKAGVTVTHSTGASFSNAYINYTKINKTVFLTVDYSWTDAGGPLSFEINNSQFDYLMPSTVSTAAAALNAYPSPPGAAIVMGYTNLTISLPAATITGTVNGQIFFEIA